jgi:hypothetical protein
MLDVFIDIPARRIAWVTVSRFPKRER